MTIDAGFFIWMVMTAAVILLLIANLFSRERPARGRVVAVAQPEHDATPDANPEDKETRHWTAQGLHKLGYSMTEARRMADMVPTGYGLQDAIQWCLRNKGSK